MATMKDVDALTNKGLQNGNVDLTKWPEGKATKVREAMTNLGDWICVEQSCGPGDIVNLPLDTELGLKALAAYHELEAALES